MKLKNVDEVYENNYCVLERETSQDLNRLRLEPDVKDSGVGNSWSERHEEENGTWQFYGSTSSMHTVPYPIN